MWCLKPYRGVNRDFSSVATRKMVESTLAELLVRAEGATSLHRWVNVMRSVDDVQWLLSQHLKLAICHEADSWRLTNVKMVSLKMVVLLQQQGWHPTNQAGLGVVAAAYSQPRIQWSDGAGNGAGPLEGASSVVLPMIKAPCFLDHPESWTCVSLPYQARQFLPQGHTDDISRLVSSLERKVTSSLMDLPRLLPFLM